MTKKQKQAVLNLCAQSRKCSGGHAEFDGILKLAYAVEELAIIIERITKRKKR